ncbi:MAG: MalY/PatB family protein [Clostridiaceae bacterium]
MNAKEFTERYLVSRTETNSLKWDALDVRFGNPDLTAMWVADMEFKTPEAVIEAMTKRVEHGVYGYSIIPESYFEALNSWHERRHGSEVKKEWVRFAPGVVNAIYWLINAFTEVNDAVLIVTPVYYPFHNAVKDTNRKLIRSELVVEDGKYMIDFEDFEKKIKENNVKMFIQCSPHNPAGRVWSEEELEKILEICEKYHVLVITDEIHQDIIIGDKKFIPASIIAGGKYKESMITLSSASKTFNLACLLNSHIIIYSELLRKRYDAFAKVTNQSEVNIMGMVATEAAYTHGEEWLEGLLDVIRTNYLYMRGELNKYAPKIAVADLEGTYLTWLDMREYIKPEDIKEFIQNKCNLAIDFGEWFSDQCRGFIRLNLATDPENVKKSVEAIIKHINVEGKNEYAEKL